MSTLQHVTLRRISMYAAQIALALLVLLFFYGTPLPTINSILPEIIEMEPTQTLVEKTPFQKTYGDLVYTFTPHAHYELRGLVVALHHSDSWLDISHENDPAQTVDICVVWGANITTSAYREVKYSHGDWTCYYSFSTPHAPAFQGELLSNTHLIPHTKEEAGLIQSIHIGDQILLSGILTDYVTTGGSGETLGKRHTSLVRTDTGNGACEVLYLNGVTILKRHMSWRVPLIILLWTIIGTWLVVEIFTSIPKHKKFEETLTGRPHVENPHSVKNFLKRKT